VTLAGGANTGIVSNSVDEAHRKTGANATVIFVPPPFAADAILEAADAGINSSCVSRRIPTFGMIRATTFLKEGSRLIGQLSRDHLPGKCKIRIMPGHIHLEGNVGVVSLAGLDVRAVGQLTGASWGGHVYRNRRSIIGTNFVRSACSTRIRAKGIVMIGEIGTAEEEAAAFIKAHVKPVVGFICGRPASGTANGVCGAIVAGGKGTATERWRRWAAGIRVVKSPAISATEKARQDLALSYEF
jgi:succinyl-CoA synthetase alpha subunit